MIRVKVITHGLSFKHDSNPRKQSVQGSDPSTKTTKHKQNMISENRES